MRIFLLENDPDVYFGVIKYLENNKYAISHARNLKDAAYYLEFDPGVDSFDCFLFDVGLPSEEVRYLKGIKGVVKYVHPQDLNGLLFLLHNLDILDRHASRVAILTAYYKQVLEMEKIEVLGINYKLKKLSQAADHARYKQEQVTKICYANEDTDISYVFSLLDKGGDKIIQQINRFIIRG
jgi:hypothetical protein